LDGRNRYLACKVAGVDPLGSQYETFQGKDALAFVLSANLRRRHLDTGQRAMVAAEVAKLPRGGDRSKASFEALTEAQAAKALNVSEGSLQRAKRVAKADAALAAEVKEGKTTLGAAERNIQGKERAKHGRTAKSGREVRVPDPQPPAATPDPVAATGGNASEGGTALEADVASMGEPGTSMTEAEPAAHIGKPSVDSVAEPDERTADVIVPVPVVAANQKLPSDPFERLKANWINYLEPTWMSASRPTRNRFVQWLAAQVGEKAA
jgi:hypothetical protein